MNTKKGVTKNISRIFSQHPCTEKIEQLRKYIHILEIVTVNPSIQFLFDTLSSQLSFSLYNRKLKLTETYDIRSIIWHKTNKN